MNAPHPVQTVRATEELLDQLVVRQTGDVSGAHSDLRLAPYCHGLMSGSEGLLSHWRDLLL